MSRMLDGDYGCRPGGNCPICNEPPPCTTCDQHPADCECPTPEDED